MDPRDTRSRPLRDLRISVTDRCNLRCRYCMPRETFGPDHAFLPRPDLLSYEEIIRAARVFTALGVEKIRLTGGEPLVRRDFPELVRGLAGVEGVKDICLTTNGVLLPRFAGELAQAGLHRVTVSLDSTVDEIFQSMKDSGAKVAEVMAGIDAAAAAGLGPIKINAVVQRGINDHTVVDLARTFRGTGHVVRFIEFMDVGSTNGWRLEHVVPGDEIMKRIHQVFPLEAMSAEYPGEVARRFRYLDGEGEIGIITSVTRPFCTNCSRARLGPDGRLFLCLFASQGHDLRALLRSGVDDAGLSEAITALWQGRTDRYSEVRSGETADLPRVEMSFIGG